MDLLALVIVLIVVVVVIGLIKAQHRSQAGSDHDVDASLPYIKRHNFFTVDERIFYRALKSAVGHQYEIFAQVRVADLLEVQKGMSKSEWQTYVHKIQNRRIDFVLCDPIDLNVICAIELGDRDQQQAAPVQVNQFLQDCFEAAALPLLHYRAKHAYSDQDIIGSLQTSLALTISDPALAKSVEMIEVQQISANRSDRTVVYKKTCPECSADMLRKKVVQGKHFGEIFWCCTKHPDCDTVMPLAEEAL